MGKEDRAPLPETEYWQHYQGAFSSILNWDDVDAFWRRVLAMDAGWYVFVEGEKPPVVQATDLEFAQVLNAAETLVNLKRRMSYSGAIYIDNVDVPSMIKIFDPVNMGSACACSGERIMPKYILSRMKPDALPEVSEPAKQGLMARLLGRATA